MVKRRMGIMAILLSLFLGLMPYHTLAVSTADAREQIDPNKECSLTLSYRYDGKAASGQTVKIYQIAEVSSDAEYTLTPSFADSGLILNGIQTNREWNVVRSTMESYILSNQITPTGTAVTDDAGKVHFTGLQSGLYLVSGVQIVQDDLTCLFDSALIALPGLNADGFWQYYVSAAAKPEVLPPVGPDGDPDEEPDGDIRFKVVKLWKGDEGHKDRPSDIEIEIFRNGISYEIKTLSEENHWAYSWKAKNDGASWNVVERNIPEGYTMTLEKRGKTFILTNVFEPDVPAISIEDPPEKDDVEDIEDIEDIDDVDDPDILEDPKVPSGNVPQTGDTTNILLYAVLMFVSGSILLILGMTEKRNRHEEK